MTAAGAAAPRRRSTTGGPKWTHVPAGPQRPGGVRKGPGPGTAIGSARAARLPTKTIYKCASDSHVPCRAQLVTVEGTRVEDSRETVYPAPRRQPDSASDGLPRRPSLGRGADPSQTGKTRVPERICGKILRDRRT